MKARKEYFNWWTRRGREVKFLANCGPRFPPPALLADATYPLLGPHLQHPLPSRNFRPFPGQESPARSSGSARATCTVPATLASDVAPPPQTKLIRPNLAASSLTLGKQVPAAPSPARQTNAISPSLPPVWPPASEPARAVEAESETEVIAAAGAVSTEITEEMNGGGGGGGGEVGLVGGGEEDMEEDGAQGGGKEQVVLMWGYLPGVSPQRSPMLGPVPVRLPPTAAAGDVWRDVCGGGCGFALALSGDASRSPFSHFYSVCVPLYFQFVRLFVRSFSPFAA